MQKIIYTLLLLVLFSDISVADKKCKFDYDKEDKVTGEKIQYFNFGFFLGGFKIQIGNQGKRSYFSFGYDAPGDKSEVIRKESDTLYIRLSNKEMIKLNAKEDTRGTAHIVGRQVNTFYSPIYYLTDEQLKALSENTIIAFKYYIEGKDYNIDMPEKKADKIMSASDCLRQSK